MTTAHVANELNIYSEAKNPGYAILINAPWGAGKTYFIKNWMAKRKDTIYLSIYGVSTTAQFEAALIEATFQADRNLKPPIAARKLEEVTKHWAGLSLGISDSYRRMALKSAPQVVVIDDLERSSIGPNEALGLINDLLEHHKRNIILLSCENELIKKWSKASENYLNIKEKVIGRILSLEPNTTEAVSSLILEMKTTGFIFKLKKLLRVEDKEVFGSLIRSEKDLIISIFAASGYKNLRLLRQSLRDFSRVYPTLLTVVDGNREKVKLALSSYLALSMAFHRGQGFDVKCLEQEESWDQAIWSVNGKAGDRPERTMIEELQERYAGIPEVNLQGLVISKDLALATISKGIFDAQVVREELLKSPYLAQTKEGSWRLLWQWRYEKSEAVDIALRNVLEKLSQNEYSDPIVLLHIFCILKNMETHGVELELNEPVGDYARKYISSLVEKRILSTKFPKTKYKQSISDENQTGLAFLGEDAEFFRTLVSDLEEALDRSFWNWIKENPEKFSSELSSNPRSLFLSLDDRGERGDLPNYAHIPVLGFTKIDKMADSLIEVGPKNTSTFIAILGKRIERLRETCEADRGSEWPSEAEWLKRLRDEISGRVFLKMDKIESVQFSALVSRMDEFLGL